MQLPQGNQSESQRISIREVNMTFNYITGVDAYGRSYQITLDFHDPLVAIPQINEIWLATRRGNDWILDKRLETGDEQLPVTAMNPGDRRVEAPGTLFLSGIKVVINGVDINVIVADIITQEQADIAFVNSEIAALAATPNRVEIDNAGSAVGTRHKLNFIAGPNTTLGFADNPGSDSVDVTITGNVQTPPGVITAYAGSSAPTAWALCDGSPISRTINSALFTAIGTTYGVGDGSTTFNLPDLRGRIPVGQGTNADVSTLGANEGFAVGNRTMKHYHGKGTLNITASGSHTHTFTGTLASIGGGAHGHTFTGSAVTSGINSVDHTHTVSVSGSTSSDNGHSHGYQYPDFGTGAPAGGSSWAVYAGTSHSVQTDFLGPHSHSVSASGTTSGTSANHTHSVTAAGTISNTDTHTHSYTPAGTLSSDTHVHTSADFAGNVGTTTGIPETPAYLVLNYIIKL